MGKAQTARAILAGSARRWARVSAMVATVIVTTVLFGPGAATAQDGAAEPAETATYRLEVQFDWSAARHPLDYPPNAHFSSIIGAVHHGRYSLFQDGDTASSGFALVATNGRTAVLQAELAEAMRRGRVASVFTADGIATGTGAASAVLTLSARHPLASFATMLAPSPDWATGVAGVALWRDGRWLERVSRPLWVWDAGADSGESFRAPNAETQPRQSVRLAATPHFLGPDGLRPVGRATFVRIK